MTRDEQIAHYNDLRAMHKEAQRQEVLARNNCNNAADELCKRLLAEVPASARNRTITRYNKECMIVDVRCTSWNPTTVNPVVVSKINKGKSWGKTRAIANQVYWDFEAGNWKVGA